MFSKRLKEFSQYLYHKKLARYGLVFVVYAMLVIGFVELAESVMENETLPIDIAILNAIFELTNSTLSNAMLLLTKLGSTIFVALAAIGITGTLILKRAYRSALFTLASIGGAGALILLLKNLFSRQRPMLWDQLVIENGYSFPSGHGIGSSALALTIIVLLWRTKWRNLVIVGGVLYMIVVAFSRLYLGVHYPSDILASWLVSGFWILSILLVFTYAKSAKSHE